MLKAIEPVYGNGQMDFLIKIFFPAEVEVMCSTAEVARSQMFTLVEQASSKGQIPYQYD